MFITPAFAEEVIAKTAEVAATPAEPSMWVTVAPLFIVFLIFYVLFIRPQNKRIQEHQEAIKALKIGDKIVTGGGVVAKISKIINDSEIEVEIASGVNVVILRHTLLNLYEPIKTDASSSKK